MRISSEKHLPGLDRRASDHIEHDVKFEWGSLSDSLEASQSTLSMGSRFTFQVKKVKKKNFTS